MTTRKEVTDPATNFELPNFKDTNWDHFECVIGAALNGETRTEIEEVAVQYSVARYFERQDDQRRKERGKVDSKGKTKKSTASLALRKAIGTLVKRWGKVRADPDARRVIEIYSDEMVDAGKRDLDTVMADLQFHQVGLSLFMERPKGLGLFDRFVGRLAAVYEATTEKSTTVSIPTDSEDPDANVSAFVDFVMAVDACLSKSAHWTGVQSPAAKSMAVRRALEKYKHKGKLPPDP
jgi:hypothetical protein